MSGTGFQLPILGLHQAALAVQPLNLSIPVSQLSRDLLADNIGNGFGDGSPFRLILLSYVAPAQTIPTVLIAFVVGDLPE